MPLPTETGRPVLTTNVVVFTLRDEQLKLLLIRRRNPPFQGLWSLPGGVVGSDEDVEANAMRQLEDGTGVCGIYLEQLYTFSAPERDPRERVISVAYYALVPSKRLRLRTHEDSEDVAWFSLNALPELAFDHAEMVDTAHQRLAAKLDYSTIDSALRRSRSVPCRRIPSACTRFTATSRSGAKTSTTRTSTSGPRPKSATPSAPRARDTGWCAAATPPYPPISAAPRVGAGPSPQTVRSRSD